MFGHKLDQQLLSGNTRVAVHWGSPLCCHHCRRDSITASGFADLFLCGDGCVINVIKHFKELFSLLSSQKSSISWYWLTLSCLQLISNCYKYTNYEELLNVWVPKRYSGTQRYIQIDHPVLHLDCMHFIFMQSNSRTKKQKR